MSHHYCRKECWVTRNYKSGRMVLPPISTASECESTVAENLCRYQRYFIGLERALSPQLIAKKDLPFDVLFKVYKVENVPGISVFNRQQKALDGIKSGIDIETG